MLNRIFEGGSLMIYWIMIGVWALIFIITVVIEFQTADLTTIWFCIASLIALILAIFDVHYIIQISAFAGSAVVLLLATRPLTKKMMDREIIHTNADRVIDMVGVVTATIESDGIGEVKVGNEIWRAITIDGADIAVGEKVSINSISGNKVVVSVVEKPQKLEVL